MARLAPSPRKGSLLPSSTNPVAGAANERTDSLLPSKGAPVDSVAVNREQYDSSFESNLPQEAEDDQWTTVKHRRVRSLESTDINQRDHVSISHPSALTREQVRVVKTAVSKLTELEMRAIQHRQDKVAAHREPSVSSREEEAPNRKGKTIDPRNWGNVNISQESLEVQAAVLDSFAEAQKHAKSKIRQHIPKIYPTPSKECSLSRHLPAESRPVAQFAKDSYLEAALCNVGRSNEKSRRKGAGTPSSLSSSGSSSGGKDSSSSDEDSPRGAGDSSVGGYQHRRDNRHGRSKRKRQRSSSSYGRTMIKPIPPKDYDGKADARTYHQFVWESEAYLRDGKVRGR